MKYLITFALLCSTSLFAQDTQEASSLTRTGEPLSVNGPVITIYDDTIDGDLGDRAAPTTIMLGSPMDRVTGNVGGGGVDFDDCMFFNVPVGNNVNSIVLENYIASGGNTTSGFQLYTGLPPDPGAFGDIVDVAVGPANIGQDILTNNGASPLISGDYTLCFLEGTPNQVFSVIFGSDIVGGTATVTPSLADGSTLNIQVPNVGGSGNGSVTFTESDNMGVNGDVICSISGPDAGLFTISSPNFGPGPVIIPAGGSLQVTVSGNEPGGSAVSASLDCDIRDGAAMGTTTSVSYPLAFLLPQTVPVNSATWLVLLAVIALAIGLWQVRRNQASV